MKKLILSAVVLMMTAPAFLSCSSDDNNDSQTNQLLGKWNNIREEALDANGNIVSTNIEDNGICPLDIAEFKANGMYVYTDYFTTSANDCDNETVDGTWSLADNILKLKLDDNAENSFQVIKLTETEFVTQIPLSSEEANDYELNVVTLRYVFKKM